MSELLSQLEDVRGQSLMILDSLPEDYINHKPDEDTWSIGQVLEHLALTDKSIANVLLNTNPESTQYAEVDQPLHRIVDRSHKVEAPDYLRPKQNILDKHVLKQHLTEARNKLLSGMHKFGDESELASIAPDQKHPVFGVISIRQWLQFVAEHELRHIAQMKEMMESAPGHRP